MEISIVSTCFSSSALSKHARYTIKGRDETSEFEVSRRFKDFFALHAIFEQKWPGCYVPSIPRKKKIGNREQWLINQRKELLNAFLK
jgi:hypothetical protein